MVGLTGLEAMAYGKPLIGSNIGGISELINDGKTGYLCKSIDNRNLAKKIVTLLSNPEEAIKFGKNARRLYESDYTSVVHFNRLEKIYNDLLNENKIN